jgi:hypothetical protein
VAHLRQEVQRQPERYRQLADRLIVVSIGVVLAVAAYIIVAAPG